MTSKDIQQHLQAFLYENHPYQTLNFGRCGYHEADVFMINKNTMRVKEFEVKISLSDFKADFKKKHKHLNLAARKNNLHTYIPSQFYYACPDGLISIDLIPEYAGLVYVKPDGSIEYIKEAPVLHKDKVSEKTLLGVLENLTAHRIFGCQWMTHQNKLANERWQRIEAERKQRTADFIAHAKQLKANA
ncbi:MAG: hypothetical protein EOO20_13355 [Chryseobacterium sp.]|nr:MAG: hypothetical protein EOO20_13355 [Chryseobacterium sp.]